MFLYFQLSDKYHEYIIESEREAFLAKLQEVEDWLYEDGEDETKGVYVAKLEELKKMWAPEAQDKITSWDQVRTGWPKQKLSLYGPGTDSGTFDYFTDKVVGKEKSSRGDYTASEDDNVLVQGVSSDKGALGYFGYAYYLENKDKLKLVAVDAGKGPLSPTPENIADGTYSPLSRPIFVYVRKDALARP